MVDFQHHGLHDEDTEALNDEHKLNDIVDKMCMSTTHEERAHLATQLRTVVDCITDIGELGVKSARASDHSAERGPAVTALNRRLQGLLISDQQSDRLAAITAFTALINTESESIHARAQRAENAVRVLFGTRVTDIATAKAAAAMVGALSNVNSPLSARSVDHVLRNAINLIGNTNHQAPNPQLSNDRARSALVIAELAGVDKAPKFVFRFQEKLGKALWEVIWDDQQFVREQGVRGLQAILETVIIRGDSDVSGKAMKRTLDNVCRTLSPRSTKKLTADGPGLRNSDERGTDNMAVIHGTLLLVASLLSAEVTASYLRPLALKLCTLSLHFQKSSDSSVREAVAKVLPLLVRLDRSIFEGDFLNEIHKSTLQLLDDPNFPAKERGRSLISLAAIAEETPGNYDFSLLEDLLHLCEQTLRKHVQRQDTNLIPKVSILKTISHLAKASPGNPLFERYMRDDLLSLIFSIEFTGDLVFAVDAIGRAVPSLVGLIRQRLVNLIAATLRSRMYDKDVALMTSVHPRRECEKTLEDSDLSRQSSMSSMNGSALPIKGRSDKRVCNKQKNRPAQASSPLDFFKQYPFSSELHRIDSGVALASSTSSCALDGLVQSPPSSLASSPGLLSDIPPLPAIEEDPTLDKENSPCVALKAIVHYDFTGMKAQDFTSFANEFVIGYVESQIVKVRALAVAASAKLMESAASVWSKSRTNGRSLHHKLRPEIQSILAQLLLLSVADPSKDVRYVAIRSLDRRVFYSYLLQPEMLNTLFMCFHDESLAIRNCSVSLAARLSDRNPAHVFPALRKYLLHLLTTLRFDGDHFERDRRDATKLIYALVHNAGTLIEPYTNTLVEALLIRLQETKQKNDSVSALPVLSTIAELGGVMSRIDLKPYRASFVPLIVSWIQQVQLAEAVVRKAALRALAAIVQNTGYVIRPYVEHNDLLPVLLQLLQEETDAAVRLQAETLIGSLGAVDPDNHKYAAIPMYSGSRSSARSFGNGGQSRSLFQLENQFALHGSQRGGSGSRLLNSRSSSQRLSGSMNAGHHRQPHPSSGRGRNLDGSRVRESHNLLYTTDESTHDIHFGGMDVTQMLENANTSICIFALGGARLSMIAGYTPVWDRERIESVSLVGQLEHPFTSSPDYYPSAALDLLHNIISNPRLRSHHREACEATVNVLKSVGPKCSYFLPAVVPRVLSLLAQSSRNETRQILTFSRLQQHVVQCLGDIISTAGHSYLPYTFDTVLLSWYYLKNIEHTPGCIASICGLLARVRFAIGDEFKPVIATVLPPLLTAMDQDRSLHGTSAKAVLHVLEAFSPLLDEYGTSVLVSLTKIVSRKRSSGIRQDALITTVRLLEEMSTVEVLSVTIHTLVQTLTGLNHQTPYKQFQSLHDRRGEKAEDTRLAVLAATALLEIGNRSSQGFDVFIPVIAKALKYSDIRLSHNKVYESLEKLLLQRNPDVVGEIFGTSAEEIKKFRTSQHFMDEAEDSRQRAKLVQELVPSRRGRGPDGYSFLNSANQARNIHSAIVSEENLMQKWEVDHSFTSEDWVKWIADLGAAMLAESGAPAFRGCLRISESYPEFTRNLFNAAFLSCWVHPLSKEAKSKICGTLEDALISETIPLNVLQSLLKLFEFMDHDEKPLPAGTERLASIACKCGALAKAVRYREQEYTQHVGKPEELYDDINGEDGLIAIYEKLGHIESAVGTITHYQNQRDVRVKEKWFEKLQRWDDALQEYEKENKNFTDDPTKPIYLDKQKWQNTLGRLRCLNEMGEWHKMNFLVLQTREACNGNARALRELALEGKGLSVALDLARWEEFEDWVSYLHEDTFEGCFYRTILMIRYGREDPSKLDHAEHFLHAARKNLDLALTARVSEGYPRAYSQIVEAQILTELEEMISLLRTPPEDAPFGMRRLKKLWDDRLRGCKRDRYTWYRVLMMRTLVLSPIDDKHNWLSFAALCRKTGRLPMACHALQMLRESYHVRESFSERSSQLSYGMDSALLGSDLHRSPHMDSSQDFARWDVSSVTAIQDLEIKFACIKYMWAKNRRMEAYQALEACRDQYQMAEGKNDYRDLYYTRLSEREDRPSLAAEVFSKLSKWGSRLHDDDNIDSSEIVEPLEYAEKATIISSDWYKAWHNWAQLNATRFEATAEGRDTSIGPRIRSSRGSTYRPHTGGTHLKPAEQKYLTNAVRGYFRAIDLAGKTTLEDSLKVLTLWFNYGGLCGLHEEFDKGFRETNIAQWLEVVPQIIARLYTPFPEVQRGVKLLLARIGTEHPHVAVYPLTVAKSTVGSHQQKRSQAANEILQELRRDHKEIVEQAELVSTELVRVAVLWTETWYESLDEASKMYFVGHNIEEFLDSLLPLHEDLERGGETQFEREFQKEFGEKLREAGDLCRKFRSEHRRGRVNSEALRQYLNDAWVIYHDVFKKIQRQQQGMHVLDLSHVSNGLRDATGLLLAVPGTYHPDENVPVVGIQSFNPQLNVIQSKQRPRKLGIIGSDGNEYQFLLKGHEDLRQDERVMQVFGLINKLFLKSSRRQILRGVGLKTYAVIALSANAGLIEWVPDCDTMHALVKEFREVRRIMPNIEQRVMFSIAPEPDRLSLLHKVDLFEFMLQHTGGADIANVLWLKSRNSEMWLDRRTTYAKSLATTSMTGYLLGLGDRHPSNLMIERSTGKIMHIDFGDCFEVAMKREKYPEKVPFRLTRMLVEALEPCGVDGYFRHTSEATLEVLRQQNARESLMSMMEAFVYDPLIRWKLLGPERLVQIRHEEAVNQRNNGALTSAEAGGIIGESTGAKSDIVRSLHEAGSLRASTRVSQTRQTSQGAGAEAVYPGAIPTPNSSRGQNIEEGFDNQRTPSEQARLELQRMLKEGDPTHVRITDVSNAEARAVLSRFAAKLCGTDYPDGELHVPEQVERLIRDARNVENLCQLFMGWCAFW